MRCLVTVDRLRVTRAFTLPTKHLCTCFIPNAAEINSKMVVHVPLLEMTLATLSRSIIIRFPQPCAIRWGTLVSRYRSLVLSLTLTFCPFSFRSSAAPFSFNL